MCTTCKGTGIYRRMEDGEIVEGDEIGEVGEEIEKVVEVKNHKRCNGNGIYRYSFWKSQNYYFDLDRSGKRTLRIQSRLISVSETTKIKLHTLRLAEDSLRMRIKDIIPGGN